MPDQVGLNGNYRGPHSPRRCGCTFISYLNNLRLRYAQELLARTGYLAAVGALPDGPRCREDLLSFTAWAAGAGRAGLPALIRAMDAAAANGGLSQSVGGQTRPGRVSVMTVQRSMGGLLETADAGAE